MKAQIEIDMGNSAFSPHNGTELARILRLIADAVYADDIPPFRTILKDCNGNTVGHFTATKS